MTTTITSNGSKWLGQEPDSIETLLDVLGRATLDPRFEDYGCFAYPAEGKPGTWRFFGNFLTTSHVFNIDTDEPETIAALRAAIDANRATERYQRDRAVRMQAKEELRQIEAARVVSLSTVEG